jgi:hypothetical protein
MQLVDHRVPSPHLWAQTNNGTYSAPYLRRRSRHPTPHLLAFDGSGHVIVIFVVASGLDQLLRTALVS